VSLKRSARATAPRRSKLLRRQATEALRRWASFLWVARDVARRARDVPRAGHAYALDVAAWCLGHAEEEKRKRARLEEYLRAGDL
jgi:hypothetical protein